MFWKTPVFYLKSIDERNSNKINHLKSRQYDVKYVGTSSVNDCKNDLITSFRLCSTDEQYYGQEEFNPGTEIPINRFLVVVEKNPYSYFVHLRIPYCLPMI